MLETEKLIAEVAAGVGPLVVGLGRGSRGGSGVIVAPGQIATLGRNLRGDDVLVTFAGGQEAAAKLIGAAPDMDLALLAVETPDIGEGPRWSNHTAADAAPLAIGTAVLALADPSGRGLRVGAGHTAAAARSVRGPRGRMIAGVIEHTAPLPRGSGGGPLVDVHGGLLGINAVRLDGGLILALPGALVRERIEQIAAGRVQQPRRLGVAIVPPRAARRLRRAVGLDERQGLLVGGVAADSPAGRAGVRRGDLIVGVGGKPVAGVDELYAALDELTDPTLVLGVVRGAEEHELTLAFDEQSHVA